MDDLFQIVTNNEATVAEMWDQVRRFWYLTVVRSLNDWQLPLVENLFSKLSKSRGGGAL